jgi:hypothetical protein
MAGTQFRLPSDGDLTVYQDTTSPCQIPCKVCSGGMVFLLVGEREKAPEPPLHRHVHAQIGLVLAPVKGTEDKFRRIGWFLEHLREKESSFTTYSEVREITII